MLYRQQNYDVQQRPPMNFNKISLGAETLDDAILEIGALKRANPNLTNLDRIEKAIANNDVAYLREVSDYFYRGSGIYAGMIRYLSNIFMYDWFLVPHIHDKKKLEKEREQEKLKEEYHNALDRLEKFQAKTVFRDIARKVLTQGVYYGYKVEGSNNAYYLQELPPNYCRHIWDQGFQPMIEFNMAFFDDYFKDQRSREAVLKAFPKEFEKGYKLYKSQKNVQMIQVGDNEVNKKWYPLDPENTVRFNIDGTETPAFITVIPDLINLDEAKEVDKKRTYQRLLKIIIQKLPLDKNGEMLFDEEEGKDIHNNAVKMLSRAVGTDVLTTFADVNVESLSDTSVAASQSDDLERFERQVFNEANLSELLFNTSGAAGLDKSILNDESTMRGLKNQFQIFLNSLLDDFNKNQKVRHYTVDILNTTIYNYKEMSKLYKEQMQVGFSKLLPQIAMGQSQGAILASAYFENDILDLINVFIPPLMSSTMNADILDRKLGGQGGNNQEGEKSKGGRPTNESKGESTSEKTIANKESAQ